MRAPHKSHVDFLLSEHNRVVSTPVDQVQAKRDQLKKDHHTGWTKIQRANLTANELAALRKFGLPEEE